MARNFFTQLRAHFNFVLEKKIRSQKKGSMMLFVIVFSFIAFTVVIFGVAGYAISEFAASRYKQNQEKAFDIAEAGIADCRWHLSNSSTDYWCGSTTTPPVVRDYKDKDGNIIGKYSLSITPPSGTSTVVTVESTGSLAGQPNVKKAVRARFGLSSLADYVFVSNADAWFSRGHVVHGMVHSNSGIRFDGSTDSPVTSAVTTYLCQPMIGNGCSGTQDGIWGSSTGTAYWSFPVPPQDFGGGAVALAKLRISAKSGGLYLATSGEEGWYLHFTSNGKVTISKVNGVTAYKGIDPADLSDTLYNFYVDMASLDPGSPTVYDLPANGVIFTEDKTWVDGTIKGRATVGVGSGQSIVINDDIVKTTSTDQLGLIAEGDIVLPHDVPGGGDLRIDSAVLAVYGAVKRYSYQPVSKLGTLTINGSVSSAGRWAWSYVNNGGNVVDGFNDVIMNYDTNLHNNPPIGFPRGSMYNLISWEEFKP